ncbi:heterokaryon incompatibility protein-domain-containing protein [Cladorrhinum sp. PSN259]|nr:heterokaryon incompatibility protein-domain-containing protein [Cladorrhinum sp. PSN259]
MMDEEGPVAKIIQDATEPLLTLCDICKECVFRCYKYIDIADGAVFQLGYDGDVVSLGGNEHHKSRREWEDAIYKDCYICCRLRDLMPSSVLLDSGDPALESETFLECEISYHGSRPPLICITRSGHGIRLSMLRAALGKVRTEIYNVGPSTDSVSVWERAQEWIADCTLNHKRCQESDAGGPWYPTRLLDIGIASTESGTVGVIKLVETSQNEKGNHANFLLGIPNLPRTFEHAVQAARKLQVRYLWIDSLCIIQDEPEDWAKEAQLMHKVYRHAWCNISATASRNSGEDLFRTRTSERLVGPLVLDFGGPRNAVLVEEDYFTAAVELSPLQTVSTGPDVDPVVPPADSQQRAWVLQERLLSPRILHFAENQVFWECNTNVAGETFPDSLKNGMAYHSMGNIISSAETPLQNWAPVLRNYTQRSLSYASDKLPAILGIAETLGRRWSGTYHCGIWNNGDILPQLAWHVDSASGVRPHPPRAPTWSWASVDGPVSLPEWSRKGFDPIAQIVHCESATDDKDPRKPVRGLLIVEGPLKKYVPASPPDDRFPERYRLVKRKDKVLLDAELCPMDNLYILPLYRESYMDYDADRHGASVDRVYHILLTPDDLDPSTLRRCGLEMSHHPRGWRPSEAKAGFTVGEYLGSERGYRVRIL